MTPQFSRVQFVLCVLLALPTVGIAAQSVRQRERGPCRWLLGYEELLCVRNGGKSAWRGSPRAVW